MWWRGHHNIGATWRNSRMIFRVARWIARPASSADAAYPPQSTAQTIASSPWASHEPFPQHHRRLRFPLVTPGQSVGHPRQLSPTRHAGASNKKTPGSNHRQPGAERTLFSTDGQSVTVQPRPGSGASDAMPPDNSTDMATRARRDAAHPISRATCPLLVGGLCTVFFACADTTSGGGRTPADASGSDSPDVAEADTRADDAAVQDTSGERDAPPTDDDADDADRQDGADGDGPDSGDVAEAGAIADARDIDPGGDASEDDISEGDPADGGDAADGEDSRDAVDSDDTGPDRGEIGEIVIELAWPEEMAFPEGRTDLDLHFAHPFANSGDWDGDGADEPWFDMPFDCFWFNGSPPWGSLDPIVDDDPSWTDLGTSEERISMNNAEPGNDYRVAVHSFGRAAEGTAPGRLRIWVRGDLVLDETRELAALDLWDVGSIAWPAGTLTRCDDDCLAADYAHPLFP